MWVSLALLQHGPCSEMFVLGSPFQWLQESSVVQTHRWTRAVVSQSSSGEPARVCLSLPCSTIWKKLDWGLKALVACIDLGTFAAPWVVWSVALLSSGIFHYSGYLHSLVTLDSGELIYETVESWLYSDLICGVF